jgi:DNA-binding winged helix-turn-helix (wHTH) protein
MSQRNLAIVDLNAFRSDPPSRYTGRTFHEERSRVCIEGGIGLPVSAMSFGPFHVLPSQRLLLEGDRPLRLGSRALDILVALVERAGELVSKTELMARVWPDTFVEEDNLKVQIAALRRTLRDGENGNRYISTVVGRGYWFVAPVVRSTLRQMRPAPAGPCKPSARAHTNIDHP